MYDFFEEEFWGYVFIVVATLSVIGIGFAIYKYEANSELCRDKGGTLIETPNGYTCVKLERVKLI